MADQQDRSWLGMSTARLKSRLSALPRVLKATGGVALLVLVVLFACLDRPVPVKAEPGFRPIAFFAPSGQVAVASGDVKEIQYSFDGKTWTHAEGLNVSATAFEKVEYATARLDPQAKDRHTKVAIKYVKKNGSDSPLAEFTYDPKESIDHPGARNGQEEVGTVVYASDFEGAPGSLFPEWSSSTITFSNRFGMPLSGTKDPEDVTNVESPKGNSRFLGEFGGPRLDPTARTRVEQTVRLALKELAPHTRATVSFDLLILKSWDGSSPRYGPDRWSVRDKDGPTLLDTTFSNNPKLAADQSFQDYPAGHGKPQWGASAVRTLGYTFFGDSIYHLSFTFPHTADALVLDFASDLFEGKGTQDESWGLDNVTVRIANEPLP